jgi:hypothetical protein
MLLKIVYLLMRWSFGLIALVFRGDHAKDAELLVLRHENVWVPRRSSTSCDQLVFVDHAADLRVPSDTVLLKIDRFR